MKTIDISGMIVCYNFLIGALIVLASEKVAASAGSLNRSHGKKIARLTHVSVYTFGACVAVLSAAIYVLFHLLRIGV